MNLFHDAIGDERARLACVKVVVSLSLLGGDALVQAAGLQLAQASREKVRLVARKAFTSISEGAERLEEFEYDEQRLRLIWNSTQAEWAKVTGRDEISELHRWISTFMAFLTRKSSVYVHYELMLMMSNPAHRGGVLSPEVRTKVTRQVASELKGVHAHRTDPADSFDRLVFSYWVDAGRPTESLLAFAQEMAAMRVVKAVAASAANEDRAALEQLVAEAEA